MFSSIFVSSTKWWLQVSLFLFVMTNLNTELRSKWQKPNHIMLISISIQTTFSYLTEFLKIFSNQRDPSKHVKWAYFQVSHTQILEHKFSLSGILLLTRIMDEAAQSKHGKGFLFCALCRFEHGYEVLEQADSGCSSYSCVWKNSEHMYKPSSW